jgi:hypothetical protein
LGCSDDGGLLDGAFGKLKVMGSDPLAGLGLFTRIFPKVGGCPSSPFMYIHDEIYD